MRRMPKMKTDCHERMDFLDKSIPEKSARQFGIFISPFDEPFIETVHRQYVVSKEAHIARFDALQLSVPHLREEGKAQGMVHVGDLIGEGHLYQLKR